MRNSDFPPSTETADQVAQEFFGIQSEAARRQHIRQLLLAAGLCAGLVPALFYWQFGHVGGFGWAVTTFFVGYCLLAAVGLYVWPQREYHTAVFLRGDWVDWIGAFWLVSCVFGPLLGWMITAVFPITAVSWRWLYGLRLLLAAGLPLITALPNSRYLRGRAVWIALPLLAVITSLPLLTVVNITYDLWFGPSLQFVPETGELSLFLRFTVQFLE
jgi:hypothetical protein